MRLAKISGAWLAGTVSLVMSAGSARATILVDDFTSVGPRVWPHVETTTKFGKTGFVEQNLTDVLGGARSASAGDTTMDVEGYDTFRVDVATGPGYSFLDVSSSAGAKGGVLLHYGDLPFNFAPPLGLPQTADTRTLRVTFLEYDDGGGVPLSIRASALHQDAPTSGHIIALPVATLPAPGPQSVDIPLTKFWDTGLGTLDGVELLLVGDKGTDYRIDSITLVPEPASIVGLAVAAGAVALRRRRA